MNTHDIAVSVVSSANPWIDFVEPDEAPALAAQLNDDLEAICAVTAGRLLGFGVLALQRPETCAAELKRIAGHPHMRGVIIGSAGRGKGPRRSGLRADLEGGSRCRPVRLHPSALRDRSRGSFPIPATP